MNLENDYLSLGPEALAYLDRAHGLFINGRIVPTKDSFALIDPTSGRAFAHAAEATAADVDAAVKAARNALTGHWSQMRPHQREECMLRLAALLEKNATELSEIETVCSGRLLANTRGIDVLHSAHVIRYMAGWATKFAGETKRLSVPPAPDGDWMGYTFREPVGVVAAIVPWNVALGLAVWKIAPALATGSTVVLKPSPSTPLSVLRFAELAIEAGIPEGVLNIVTGSGPEVGQALIRHPDVALVTFTGSTKVGRHIAAEAAGLLKRHSLELGGKSPVIFFEDASVEKAIPEAAFAIFANHGQNCCAGSRLYVHRSIYNEVVEGVAAIARTMTLGSPLTETAQMGPVINRAHRDRVLSYVEAGKSQGARLAAGGEVLGEAFIRPTVLADVRSDMKPVREEIFGPVLVAAPFEEESEVLALANDSEFGLGASVWTNDLSRVHRMTKALQSGSVWINCHNVLDVALPFGGWKNSGIGADLSETALLAYTKVKASVHRY